MLSRFSFVISVRFLNCVPFLSPKHLRWWRKYNIGTIQSAGPAGDPILLRPMDTTDYGYPLSSPMLTIHKPSSRLTIRYKIPSHETASLNELTVNRSIKTHQLYLFNLPYNQVRSLADKIEIYKPYSAARCSNNNPIALCHTICLLTSRFAVCSRGLSGVCIEVLSIANNCFWNYSSLGVFLKCA